MQLLLKGASRNLFCSFLLTLYLTTEFTMLFSIERRIAGGG